MHQLIPSHRAADVAAPEPPVPSIPFWKNEKVRGVAVRLLQLASMIIGPAVILVVGLELHPAVALVAGCLHVFITAIAVLEEGTASKGWYAEHDRPYVLTVMAWWPLAMPYFAVRRIARWILTGK